MKYRLSTMLDGHWRRECRTGSRRYAIALLRALVAAGIDADVRGLRR